MRKLGDMNWANSILAKEIRPVVLEILVKDSVSNIEREEVLYLHRGA